MGTSPSNLFAATLSHIAVGYLVGCGTAALGFIAYLLVPDAGGLALTTAQWVLGLIGVTGMAFLTICLLSLPGFVATRLVLHRLKRTDWPSFAVAGGLLGLIYTLLFFGPQTSSLHLFWKYPPSPILTVLGALAGVACSLTEAHLARLQAVEGPPT